MNTSSHHEVEEVPHASGRIDLCRFEMQRRPRRSDSEWVDQSTCFPHRSGSFAMLQPRLTLLYHLGYQSQENIRTARDQSNQWDLIPLHPVSAQPSDASRHLLTLMAAPVVTIHPSPVTERQVSRGAVWSVGGLAPLGHPVDDGRGHMIRSGTHAQVYTTPVSRGKSTLQGDSELYQGRIARALNIDRVRKILDFSGRSTSPQASRDANGRLTKMEAETKWNGVGWVSAKETEGDISGQSQGLVADGYNRRSITEAYKLSYLTSPSF
ncbi:Meiosis-specific APC/C activator protein-like protein [Emericellopsis cladophorae]|uniref:Meiosis-specific APC/C activator protein-like protein n=1 Tax=Emericellopsis cladophorae TaxID=2686198 RepID=A0A9P9XZR5_9HYPO|nr:Meiosis-specific APC/C activator protein-like protein [Emericellopsis cladophorae]KAI6780314.1 Meiosis-specific APC/C activator protein-like protein [Emericellopsis cladophorae]